MCDNAAGHTYALNLCYQNRTGAYDGIGRHNALFSNIYENADCFVPDLKCVTDEEKPDNQPWRHISPQDSNSNHNHPHRISDFTSPARPTDTATESAPTTTPGTFVFF